MDYISHSYKRRRFTSSEKVRGMKALDIVSEEEWRPMGRHKRGMKKGENFCASCSESSSRERGRNAARNGGMAGQKARSTLSVLLLALIVSGSPSQDMAADAVREIQAGHYREACDLLRAGLRQSPKDAELWNLLGIAESELKDTGAAEKAFEEGLKIAPGSASLNENAGLLFFREAKYGQAKQALERATKLGSQKPGVLFSLATAKLRTGEAAAGLRELKSLEPALSGVPEYWEERGRAELPYGARAAETSFERALSCRLKASWR